MNFDKGLAGEFTVDIMQHMVRNKKLNDNLNARYENGRTRRCQIDTQRRLTGGVLFDANHIILDKDVLCLRKSKEQEKIDEKEATVSKAIQRYHLLKEAYLKVVNSSTDEAHTVAKTCVTRLLYQAINTNIINSDTYINRLGTMILKDFIFCKVPELRSFVFIIMYNPLKKYG